MSVIQQSLTQFSPTLHNNIKASSAFYFQIICLSKQTINMRFSSFIVLGFAAALANAAAVPEARPLSGKLQG